MNSLGLAIACVLFAGCAASTQPNLLTKDKPSSQPALECLVHSVEADGQSIGTAFSYLYDGKVSFLTAWHVVAGLKLRQITLRSGCNGDRLRVMSLSEVNGLDLAVLTPSELTSAASLAGREKGLGWGEKIYSPNFSNLSRSDARLKDKMILSAGTLIESNERVIFTTLDVSQKGSSGAPLLDSNNKLIGMLTNRILVDGNFYSGAIQGISKVAIDKALANIEARALADPKR